MADDVPAVVAAAANNDGVCDDDDGAGVVVAAPKDGKSEPGFAVDGGPLDASAGFEKREGTAAEVADMA